MRNGSTDSPNRSTIKNNCIERKEDPQARPNGLAPHTKRPTVPMKVEKPQPMLPEGRGYFYAYSAYDPNGMNYGEITFDIDGQGNLIDGGAGINFISGEAMDPDGNCYGVDYYGGLYSIDLTTGACTLIGSTIPLNGMTLDTTTMTYYVSGGSPDWLNTIDITTGATTPVGPYGISNTMISIFCDKEGNMYGYDALFSGNSHLYSIDKATGAASIIGDMGHTFCYAQDGVIDRNDDTCYLAAYDIGQGQSYLATCDLSTAAVTILGTFNPTGIEIDGFAGPYYTLVKLNDDVGVSKITAPATGNGGVITPQVTVKNYGNNSEYSVPVEMKIVKNQYTDYMNEHFNEASFPPNGWSNIGNTSDYWVQSAENYAGGASPEAVLWYYNNYGGNGVLQSPYVDTSTATSLTLNFRSYILYWGGPCLCKVYATGDGGTTWNDVSPWSNPITATQGPKLYSIDLSAYIGAQTGVKFVYSGQYNWLYSWAIDDVRMFDVQQIPEYDQTVYTDVYTGTSMNVTFPDWTPSDLGVSENMNKEYVVNATTQMSYDENTHNDYKNKAFTLHFGYFNDVAITAINSPTSGLAATQPVQVALADNGQNNENVNVNVQIGKVSYNTLLTEDFSGGVPPAGWKTDAPSHWMGSNTNYAGGTAPEAEFSWYPEETGEFHLYSPAMDTTGWTTAQLKYKEDVNDYNGNYTLKVQTSTDGGATWNDAYTRAGGAYGPTTTQITLGTANGVGSNNLMISWTYNGNAYNINYWYIDDVWFGQSSMATEYNQTVNVSINTGASANVTLPDWKPADVPLATTIDYLIDVSISMNVTDGNPADNELPKLITLSYEHDVGVIAITEPSGPPSKDITWFTYGGDNTYSIGLTTGGTFEGAIRMTPAELTPYDEQSIVSVKYCHGKLSGSGEPATDGYMKIYGPGTPTSPGTLLDSEPFYTPAGNDWFQYDFMNPVQVDASQDMWFSIECDNIPAGAYPLGCDAGPAIDGKADWIYNQGTWAELQTYDLDYNWNHMVGFGYIYPSYWPTGTYQVAGVVKNFGVTYAESNITVNAKITHVDNSTVIYDHVAIVPGPLAPGETALATFPNITFLNWSTWEGKYLLEIKTTLPDDGHPENDKKTMTFNIEYEPPMPPETNHSFSGTMGNNGWYISDVIITLNAYDPSPPLNIDDIPKPPGGVNHTYYKLQNADPWTEYTSPVMVIVSGTFNLSYYSVDFYGNAELVKGPFPFKIDKTTPVIINFTATPENLLKTKWLLNATVYDSPSGIARVDFYVDDVFVGTVTAAPWQFNYQGKGQKTQAVVYDNAGNSAMSNQVQVYELNVDAQSMIQDQLLVVHQIFPQR